jgi:hypothetical protein
VKTKQILFSSIAALSLTLAGTVMAETSGAPLVSGDTPMNVGQEAQLVAPTPNAAAQEATSEMLKGQGNQLTGDTPMNVGQEAQLTDPVPNAEEQAKTAADLKAEDSTGAISGKYE